MINYLDRGIKFIDLVREAPISDIPAQNKGKGKEVIGSSSRFLVLVGCRIIPVLAD
jgi:hypothetical protein